MAKRRAMLRPRLSNFFEKKMTTINILLLEASVVVELVTIFHWWQWELRMCGGGGSSGRILSFQSQTLQARCMKHSKCLLHRCGADGLSIHAQVGALFSSLACLFHISHWTEYIMRRDIRTPKRSCFPIICRHTDVVALALRPFSFSSHSHRSSPQRTRRAQKKTKKKVRNWMSKSCERRQRRWWW